jgi:hypothetical protein
MANEVKTTSSQLPDYLRGKTKTVRIGNLDASDLIIPRIKLLQNVSPELQEVNGTRAGEFYHTITMEMLGKELIGVPILLRKTYVLWAPRGDDRGILARSRDAINWDPPAGKFEVKFKNNPNVYTWVLAPTVRESNLAEFGTSRPGDPSSPPAASLTYEVIWFLPDLREYSPAILINTRGSIKPCQKLFTMAEAKPVDHYFQLYKIAAVPDQGPNKEPFWNYAYTGEGYIDEELGQETRVMYERFEKLNIRASDERDDEPAPPSDGQPKGATERSTDSKF